MTAPEFSAVQRAWLAEVHGVTLDVRVSLCPGMWVRVPNSTSAWYVTQFADRDGERRSVVSWRDARDHRDPPCWGTAAWWPVESDYVEVDPPESWVAAGRPGAIDALKVDAEAAAFHLKVARTQNDVLAAIADQWATEVGRALYGDDWDPDDHDTGITDLVPLIRPIGVPEAQRPSGEWICTVHEGTEDVEPGQCAYYRHDGEPCRWVELVYPASEGQ